MASDWWLAGREASRGTRRKSRAEQDWDKPAVAPIGLTQTEPYPGELGTRKEPSEHSQYGLDFEDTWKIFEFPMVVGIDDREEYNEERWIGIGLLEGRVVVVVFSEDDDEDVIRIISLRKALSHERAQYEQFLKDQLGQG